MNPFISQNVDASMHEESQKIEKYYEKTQLRPRLKHLPGIFQEYKRTYIKVPLESKAQLSKLVFKEGFKIKDAAKKLKIKYATAKTIIFHLREERKAKGQKGQRMCSYTELQKGKISIFRIISTTSNDIISNIEYKLPKDPLVC